MEIFEECVEGGVVWVVMKEREVMSSKFIGGDLEEASSSDPERAFNEHDRAGVWCVCDEALRPLVEEVSFVKSSNEGVEFVMHGRFDGVGQRSSEASQVSL